MSSRKYFKVVGKDGFQCHCRVLLEKIDKRYVLVYKRIGKDGIHIKEMLGIYSLSDTDLGRLFGDGACIIVDKK